MRTGHKLLISAVCVVVGLTLPLEVATPQTASGYWLYIDGAWKGGFRTQQECEAAAVRFSGQSSRCHPVAVTPQRGSSSWDAAVATCADIAKAYDPRFDAYVSGAGAAKMVGSARANHEFEKCVDGVPNSPVPKREGSSSGSSTSTGGNR